MDRNTQTHTQRQSFDVVKAGSNKGRFCFNPPPCYKGPAGGLFHSGFGMQDLGEMKEAALLTHRDVEPQRFRYICHQPWTQM